MGRPSFLAPAADQHLSAHSAFDMTFAFHEKRPVRCRLGSLVRRHSHTTDLLEQLRAWGWVIGEERLELTGIGIYHAGPATGGILGGYLPSHERCASSPARLVRQPREFCRV